jgi:transcriptional antiterminator Rof (Rho-off)
MSLEITAKNKYLVRLKMTDTVKFKASFTASDKHSKRQQYEASKRSQWTDNSFT